MATIKVFIAQSMHGKPDSLVNDIRMRLTIIARLLLRGEGDTIEILDQFNIPDPENFEIDHPTEREQRLYRLGRSIQILGKADYVIFYDWSGKGCQVEWTVCEEYGIPKLILDSTFNFTKYSKDNNTLTDYAAEYALIDALIHDINRINPGGPVLYLHGKPTWQPYPDKS